ncbi:hypothetical protein CLV49_0354 [Labedella gwakjiensis]|uniref:Uncharacterized protein n=1 Tax=Labedella gwakjiensis TaxID=390269 RepID=A0A2P8GS10_9MICO|nr:hypothetical protein [Labedella gwakjiensis]PSL36756.1 hypothetical protein CLV49_0354 [Labedella gwakjiensis]RUQ84269.1 hypothetical protein ELQ93_15750 [Labedella gwakjiensis]
MATDLEDARSAHSVRRGRGLRAVAIVLFIGIGVSCGAASCTGGANGSYGTTQTVNWEWDKPRSSR